MDGNKHYIRIDANNIVIHRFSDAFEAPLETDICVDTDAGRHYNDPYMNERGQFLYKWDGVDQMPRTQAELDAEWAARPPDPETDGQKIDRLETESVDTMLALTEVYETNEVQDTTREQETVDTMLALTETYELVLQQQDTIASLTARIAALEGGVS